MTIPDVTWNSQFLKPVEFYASEEKADVFKSLSLIDEKLMYRVEYETN